MMENKNLIDEQKKVSKDLSKQKFKKLFQNSSKK